MDKLSYALGLGLGQQLKSMDLAGTLNVEDFAQAVTDILEDKQIAFSHEEAQALVNTYFQEVAEKKTAEAKASSEAFLDENANRAGVQTTESGLQYEIIQEGTGKKPSADNQVKVHYEGTLVDGTLFDSSIKRGEPVTFGVTQVIPGWVEGLQLMSEGAKYKFYIPSDLGYGAQGAGEMIPPHSALVFEVELIEVL